MWRAEPELPVPVTAKLSRRFYEVLGDDVATELVEWFNQVDATYRADLRELNDLNFARFDAKLEQRLAEQDARMEKAFAALKSDLLRWMFAMWITLVGTMIALERLGP